MVAIKDEDIKDVIYGVPASNGKASGSAYIYKKEVVEINMNSKDCQGELNRLNESFKIAHMQLDTLYAENLERLGQSIGMIFETHKLMLEDEDYIQQIVDYINQKRYSAEYAVKLVGNDLYMMFKAMDNEYMQARSADVKDISERLISILTGNNRVFHIETNDPIVLFSEDILPSEAISMDCSKVMAFVTEGGSKTSHSVILARTLGLPGVVGCSDILKKVENGNLVSINGEEGSVSILSRV